MSFFDKKFIIILILFVTIICTSIYFFTKEEDYEYLNADNLYIETNSIESTQEISEIIIHITGEVAEPGIVTLLEGSRISDAILKAGGETELADFSKVNLAYELKDGQKVYIPSIYDEQDIVCVEDSAGNNVLVSENSSSNLVNINTASQLELEALPGIRPINCYKNY